jgi:hypothetical protein
MKSLILTACILACTTGTASAQFFGPPASDSTGGGMFRYSGPRETCPKGCARCEPSWSAAPNKCIPRAQPIKQAIKKK